MFVCVGQRPIRRAFTSFEITNNFINSLGTDIFSKHNFIAAVVAAGAVCVAVVVIVDATNIFIVNSFCVCEC